MWLAKHSGNSQEGSRDLADGEKPDAEDTGWAFQAKRGADNSPGVGKVWAAVRGGESLCNGRGVRRRQSGNRTPCGCQGSLGTWNSHRETR